MTIKHTFKKLILITIIGSIISGCAPSRDGVNYATIYAPNGEIVDKGFVNNYISVYTTTDITLENGNEYYTATQNVIFEKKKGTAFSTYLEVEDSE